ncbi:MAG: radical SAM/SPASM domain-containing protein [Ignavibacteriaceae bacterium]|nr:radical SAM/SPASM domain-containing protein [Ignavibacteriaceae bacterium]
MSELFAILKCLTLKRVLNIIRVYSSYAFSVVTGKPVLWGEPISISIEPTSICNLRCPECPTGAGTLLRPQGTMKFDFFREIINRISPKTFYLQLFFQGEPFVNKEIFKMIEYAKSKKMLVSVSTNGTLFKGENVARLLDTPPDKLIYSVDGPDEESYRKYRIGGDFRDVVDGLDNIVKEKKEKNSALPYIELQMIVMRQNEELINEFIEFGRKMGVNKVTLKTMQIYNQKDAENLLPVNIAYSRYKRAGENYIMKERLKNRCFALWRTAVITWDGNLSACCFDKDAEFSPGNIKNQNISALLRNEVLQNLRKQIFIDRAKINICSNCTEGLCVNIKEIKIV